MPVKNKKDEFEYIKETVFWSSICMFWYRKSLFRSLPDLTLVQSKIVLWILYIVLLTVGILVTIRGRRNWFSILTITLSIYEIYTLISYYRTFSSFYLIVVCIACGLSFLVFVRVVSRFRFKHEARKNLVHEALAKSHGALVLICSVIVIPMFVSYGLDDSLIWNSVNASNPADSADWTISNNIEIVGNLREDVWKELSASEKVDTLQVIANIERKYLGLPNELNVKVSLCTEHTLASYDDSTHTITLNIEFFDDQTAHEMLDSICHECFHSYQHRLCELYGDTDQHYADLLLFADIPSYVAEFTDYTDGDDDSLGYYSQLCEVRARQYAQQAVWEYYMKIQQYYDLY